jgi:hypothetical protein
MGSAEAVNSVSHIRSFHPDVGRVVQECLGWKASDKHSTLRQPARSFDDRFRRFFSSEVIVAKKDQIVFSSLWYTLHSIWDQLKNRIHRPLVWHVPDSELVG